MICDNTSHKGDPTKPKTKVYGIVLTKDFDEEKCNWCNDCIIRDRDMVKEIINLE